MLNVSRSLTAAGLGWALLLACRSLPEQPAEPTAPGAQYAPPAGIVVVANQQSASASIIELPAGTSTEVPVGTGPHEAAVTADGRLGIITVYGAQVPGSQLAVVDLATRKVVRTIELGDLRRPHGAVVISSNPDRVVVTSEMSQRIAIVNVTEGKVESVIPTNAGGSHMVAVTADGRRGFTANVQAGSVSEFDLANATFVRQIPVAPVTEGVAVTPDGAEVWVGSNQLGTVSIVGTKSGKVDTTLTGFRTPYRIGISRDGRLAVVCDPPSNSVHVVDVATRRTLGSIGDLGSPRGVSIAPDNRTAFVTLGTEGAIAVVDLTERKVIRRVTVGASPDGVAFASRPTR